MHVCYLPRYVSLDLSILSFLFFRNNRKKENNEEKGRLAFVGCCFSFCRESVLVKNMRPSRR
jgi:hypothetical protein